MAEGSVFLTELTKITKEFNLPADNIEELVKKAATEEWLITFSSNMPLNTISQIRQVRLFCLIKNVFGNIIPTEFQIERLFHITPTSAKTLLANTLSVFKTELDKAFIDSVKIILKQAIKAKNGFMCQIISPFIVSQMNYWLRVNKPDYQPIKRLNESTSYFSIPENVKEYFEKL